MWEIVFIEFGLIVYEMCGEGLILLFVYGFFFYLEVW